MSRHAGTASPLGGRVAQLQAEFDSAFSRQAVPVTADLTDVLALRIGDEPCVLRLSDIAEVIANPVITPVPTSVPALIGLTTGRGSPTAVYDLGLLLGRARAAPRWLVLAASDPGVGIGFENFDGYHRIALGPNGSAQQLIEMPTLIELITRITPHRSYQENES